MAPIIKTEKLCHTYSIGTPFEHEALKNIDFEVQQGEVIGVIGHTGSGKSTLIQHLNGLLKPTSGKVLYNGCDIWENKKDIRSIRFNVGLVFQYPEYQLFEETVFKDIAFGPKNMGLQDEEIKERVYRAAKLVGLDELDLERSPFEMSGGQKRRVAIAGVLAMQPRVLVLDEPTAGLDPKGKQQIIAQILEYRAQNDATVIFVTHSMDEIAKAATRIVVMENGEIVMDGTPMQVFSQSEKLEAMRLSVPEVTKVFEKLREMGLDVPHVYTVQQAKNAILRLREGRKNA